MTRVRGLWETTPAGQGSYGNPEFPAWYGEPPPTRHPVPD